MTEAAGVLPRGVDDGLPIGFAQVGAMPLLVSRIIPLAWMRTAVVGNGALAHPGSERFRLRGIEQVGMIGACEHRQNRCRLVSGQCGRLSIRVGNAPDRVKVVLDAIAGCRRCTSVALDATFLEDRAYVGERERRLLELTLLGAGRERQSHACEAWYPAGACPRFHGSGGFGMRLVWQLPQAFVKASA